MTSVFISYSRSDAVFADKLAVELERLYGKESVWIDRQSIPFTADWWAAIQRGIEGADNFLLILSPDSTGSPVCHLEIEHARLLGKRVLPVAHRPIDRDAARKAVMNRVAEDSYVNQLLGDRNPMSLFEANWLTISQYNWVSFPYDGDAFAEYRDGESETGAEQSARAAEEMRFHQQFLGLCSALESDLAHVRQHTRLTQRALEWDASEREEALLLDGEEVEKAFGWLSAWERDKVQRSVQNPPQAPKKPEPTDLQREYIRTSQVVDARRRRILRWLRVGTVVLSLAAAIAFVLALIFGLSAASTRGEVGQANATLNAIYPTSTAIANQLENGSARVRALDMLAAAQQELNSGNALTASLLGIRSVEFAHTENGADVLERSLRANYAAWYAPNSALNAEFTWGGYLQIAFGSNDRDVIVGDNTVVVVLDRETGKVRRQQQGRFAGRAADGSVIVATVQDDQTILSNIETGETVATLSGVDAIYSPMGRYVATQGVENNTAYTYVWDAVSGDRIERLEGSYPMFSPDERLVLLSREGGNQTAVWSLESNTQLDEVNGSPYGFSPDSKQFVTSNYAQTLLWKLSNVEPLTLSGHEDLIISMSFSSDGSKLVTTAGQLITEHGDKTAMVWDTASGQRLLTLRGQDKGFNDAVFSPDDRFIVTTSYDGQVIVWDANTGEQAHVLGGHTAAVLGAAVSQNSRYIATIGEDGVMLWDLSINDNRLLQLEGNSIDATNADFSPDGRFIVTSSVETTGISYETDDFDNNKAILWDARTGARVRVLGREVGWATFDRTGRLVATSDALWHGDWIYSEVANIASGQGGALSGYDPVFSPGNRYVFTTETTFSPPLKGIVRLYDALTLDYTKEVDYFDAGITSASMSSDETLLATATQDRRIVIWTVPSSAVLTYIFPEGADITHVEFSPDDSRLVSSQSDGYVTVWDVRTWQVEKRFLASVSQVNDVTFSADGSLLATASDAEGGQPQAIIWDTHTWEPVRSYAGHEGNVNTIRFNADGSLMITAGSDSTVQVWNSSYEGLIEYACERMSHLRDLTIEEAQKHGASPWPSCETPDWSRAHSATPGNNRGTIAAGEFGIWTYAGVPGDSISVSVSADEPAKVPDNEGNLQGLDTVVTIYEPDLSAYVINDDIESNVNTNSRIDQFMFTHAGNYVIIVSSYNGQSGGSYTLDIEPVSGASSPEPQATPSSTFTPMPTLTPTVVDFGG